MLADRLQISSSESQKFVAPVVFQEALVLDLGCVKFVRFGSAASLVCDQ